jgi:chaperonin GroES
VQAAIAKKLFPLLDRVLIQRAEALTKTAGGIVIPEKAQSKVLKGTIIAVGPGARNQVRMTKESTRRS